MITTEQFIILYKQETGITLTEDEAKDAIRKAAPLLAFARSNSVELGQGAKIEDTFLYGKVKE